MSSSFELNKTYCGDVRELVGGFPDSSFDLVCTSPPYFKLRKYTSGLGGTPDSREIGREQTPEEFVKALVDVFRRIKPKMKSTGSLWVNIDDTFRRGPLMVPEKFALAMIEAGFWIRNKVIWYKPDAPADSAKNRFTRKYEVFYWFSVEPHYYFDEDATNIPVRLNTVQRMEYDFRFTKDEQKQRYSGIMGNISHKISDMLEGGVDCGDVWIIPTNKEKLPHKAPYPQELVARPIIACCPEGGVVFDPFMGSGRTAIASNRLARNSVGTELKQEYAELANSELAKELGRYGNSLFLTEGVQETSWKKGTAWWDAHQEVQHDLFSEGAEQAGS